MTPPRPPACPFKDKPYDSMVLSCIDPRIINQVNYYMNVTKKQNCRYSQFTIAGAAVGVVAEKFCAWHETFWQNLASSIELHEIKTVIAIDHRNCGAAEIAYPDECCSDPVKEREVHKRVLLEFKRQAIERHKDIKDFKVEIGLMELNGDIELFT